MSGGVDGKKKERTKDLKRWRRERKVHKVDEKDFRCT